MKVVSNSTPIISLAAIDQDWRYLLFMQTLEEIEKQALQLPKEDRGLLAEKLLRSIDDDSLTDVDEAWVEEAERRYQKYIEGKTKTISGDKIFTDIKRELGWQK